MRLNRAPLDEPHLTTDHDGFTRLELTANGDPITEEQVRSHIDPMSAIFPNDEDRGSFDIDLDFDCADQASEPPHLGLHLPSPCRRNLAPSLLQIPFEVRESFDVSSEFGVTVRDV